MGNQQPKKLGRANKNQIEMAALKAKIHLELMRDRKNNQVIKGEKELVSKINAKSRNKTQEGLIMEKIVNGLKYSQAVNHLISYATCLKSQAGFLSQNIGNQQKLEPWLPSVHSLLYAAEQLGLSSLNQFKTVMAALNNPLQAQKYINPQIKQMLSPTPTPYEVNVYVLQMCERNNIELEAINLAGHKFSKQPHPQSTEVDKSFSDIEKQLKQQFEKNIGGNNGQGGQGWGNQGGQGWGNQGGQGWGNPGQGGQGWGNPGQGGQGWGNPGQGGQGFGGGGQGQGIGWGNQGGGHGGFNPSPVNPYQGASSLKHGPDFFVPSQIKKQNSDQPKQLSNNYGDIGADLNSRKTIQPIYPSVNPDTYKGTTYQPKQPSQIPFLPDSGSSEEQRGSQGQGVDKKSPTISQIMKEWDIK